MDNFCLKMSIFVGSVSNFYGNIYLLLKNGIKGHNPLSEQKKLVDDFLAYFPMVVNQRSLVPVGLVLDSLLQRRGGGIAFLWLLLSGYGSGLSREKCGFFLKCHKIQIPCASVDVLL